MRYLSLLILSGITLPSLAEEPPAPPPGSGVEGRPTVEAKPAETLDKAAEVQPLIKKLEGSKYELGPIKFDSATREIRFPAEVNMTEGLLEFLLVHRNGKIHESLLLTEIDALHLNVVLKLLHYKQSRELFYIPVEDGRLPDKRFEEPEDVRKAARLKLECEWNQDGKSQRAPVTQWIAHGTTQERMPDSDWIYTGSVVDRGRFIAKETGDLIAIFTSSAAVLNYPGKDLDNDEVWFCRNGHVPPQGTKVTIILSPSK